MRRFILLILPVILAGAIGCGGGGKKTITIPGGGKIDVSGKVPSNFPSDFPVYKGASAQGSYTGTQNGITGSVVTWQTGDSLDKVKSFYDQEFKNGPWKSSSTGNANNTAFWVVDSPDGKQAAYVGATNDGKNTSIIVTIGDKSAITGGATEEASPTSSSSSSDQTSTSSSGDTTPSAAATLPAEAKLGSDFPTDRVSFPSGARITNTSSLTSGGVKTFYVEVYVKDTPGNVNDYFKNELPKHNWTNSLSSESNGEFFQTYSGADSSSNEGVTLNVSQSDTPGYTKVELTVMLPG